MERAVITKKVRDVLAEVLSDRQRVDSADDSTLLTGKDLDLMAVDLVYIVLELMKAFNVRFDPSDFEHNNFNTIEGIVNALEKHLES